MTSTIIVVDDSDADRYLVKRIARRIDASARVLEIEDGDEFLELVNDHARFVDECGTQPPPVLVLLDINMPRMSGFEVLDALERGSDSARTQAGEIVVLVFTSSSNERDRERALRYSLVRDYVVKPMSVEDLSRVLETHVPERGRAPH